MVTDKNNPAYKEIYYLYTDHLGSLTAVEDHTGQTVREFSYDPWGRRRDPADLNNYDVTPDPLFTRGFTGHEHIDAFRLINMNGRIYDPRLARFLSPDNYVQIPDITQNFNRYSYCLNNPLIYIDPGGEKFTLWHFAAGAFFGAASWSGIIKHAQDKATVGQAIGEYLINAATFFATAGAAQLGTAINVSGVFPGMAYGTTTSAVIGGTSAGLTGAIFGRVPNKGLSMALLVVVLVVEFLVVGTLIAKVIMFGGVQK